MCKKATGIVLSLILAFKIVFFSAKKKEKYSNGTWQLNVIFAPKTVPACFSKCEQANTQGGKDVLSNDV